MRRLLLAFLLVFLPLQSIWAGAMPYCTHEPAPEVMHIGHHVHEHHDTVADDAAHNGAHTPAATAGAAQDGDGAPAPGSLLADMDCHACHGAGSAVFLAPGALTLVNGHAAPAPLAAPALAASPPTRPERPNWPARA